MGKPRNILILQSIEQPELMESWGSLTEICREHFFPYDTLKVKKFPFDFGGYRFLKIPYNQITMFGNPFI